MIDTTSAVAIANAIGDLSGEKEIKFVTASEGRFDPATDYMSVPAFKPLATLLTEDSSIFGIADLAVGRLTGREQPIEVLRLFVLTMVEVVKMALSMLLQFPFWNVEYPSDYKAEEISNGALIKMQRKSVDMALSDNVPNNKGTLLGTLGSKVLDSGRWTWRKITDAAGYFHKLVRPKKSETDNDLPQLPKACDLDDYYFLSDLQQYEVTIRRTCGPEGNPLLKEQSIAIMKASVTLACAFAAIRHIGKGDLALADTIAEHDLLPSMSALAFKIDFAENPTRPLVPNQLSLILSASVLPIAYDMARAAGDLIKEPNIEFVVARSDDGNVSHVESEGFLRPFASTVQNIIIPKVARDFWDEANQKTVTLKILQATLLFMAKAALSQAFLFPGRQWMKRTVTGGPVPRDIMSKMAKKAVNDVFNDVKETAEEV
eukprot:GHVQ01030832.1.p1 GENE.GHVQ01030832.1~~GHVQ01030832.1.p1  ORF type:complete len:431 (-),score=51.46 GHVQ01030832.1:1012-2304(-)